MVVIERDADGHRAEDCLELARGLDRGFNETGIEAMAEDLPSQVQFVALEGDDLLGFASVREQAPGVAELAWFAVRDDRQGEGIGTRLLRAVYARRASEGDRLLTVKTLAATVEDDHYAGVREFYESEGFLHVDTIEPYPGWEPGNPCAIYARPLSDADR
jgi:GNAT superfamily N-acetyltransferase